MSDCSLLSAPRGPGTERGSATVQSGYEEDAVLVLQLVVQLTLVRERNEETIRAAFPVSPQVSGRPGEGVCVCCFGKEYTRKPGSLYFTLQISRMEDSSPRPPAPLFFLSGVGDWSSLSLEATVGQRILLSLHLGLMKGPGLPTKAVKGRGGGGMSAVLTSNSQSASLISTRIPGLLRERWQ